MSRLGKRIVRNHLGKIVRKAMKRKGFARMVARGKHVKSINYARPTDGGIMFT